MRDKEKREVDFLVLRGGTPWLCVQCKTGERTPSGPLVHFSERLGVDRRFQLVDDPSFDHYFAEHRVRVMGYEGFVAGWV